MVDRALQYPYRLRTADGSMVVRAEGRGPALLLIHGISANRSTWNRLTPLLRTEYQVVAPDLLGRGESDPAPHASFALEDEVERLECLVRQLELRTPVIVGHSHGAALALGLLRRLRTDTDMAPAGLVLVNPVCPWTRRPPILGTLRHAMGRDVAAFALRHFRIPLTRYILGRRVFGDSGVPTEAIERYAAPYADPGRARSLLAVVRDWRPEELEPYLRTGATPVHVVSGDQDRRIPIEDARRLAEILGCPFTPVTGAGHAVPEERPVVLAAVIRTIGPATIELPTRGVERGTDDHSDNEMRTHR